METPPDAPTTGAQPSLEVEEIVFTADKTKVVYARPGGDGTDRVSIESATPPSRDFSAARRAIEALALDLLEIPPRTVNKIDVRGLVFKRNSDEQPGVVIKVFRYYAEHAGGHALNTPIVFLGDKNPARTITADKWDLVTALAAEAAAWAAGKADQQADLFGPTLGETPEPGDAGDAPEAAVEPEASMPDHAGDGAASPVADDGFDDGGAALARVSGKTVGRGSKAPAADADAEPATPKKRPSRAKAKP